MVDRPILFSAPMVKALLDGRKTQTRRVLTPNNTLWNGHSWSKRLKAQTWDWAKAWVDGGPSPSGNPGPYLHLPWLAGDDDQWRDTSHRIYPIVQPGDRLWVRERILVYPHDPQACSYVADMDAEQVDVETRSHGARNRPSIHMPRWASRLTNIVTDVRVQRVQEISEEDAVAEGCARQPSGYFTADPGYAPLAGATAYGAFYCLWRSINGQEAWDANPFVVAVTFTVEQRNIDA